MKREYWPTQEWQHTDPAAAGMDAQKLSQLDQMISSQYNNINGIVVVRRGSIVYEKYFHGCTSADTQHIASATKSVTSALIGIAIDAGYIESVEQKVLSYFPEYTPAAGDIQKRTITIRHLLTMTAPFNWKTTDRRNFEPLDRLRRQRDWVNYILNLMGRNGQPGRFQYCTAAAHLLSAILTRTTGMSALAFANERLFEPLGMRRIPEREMKSFTLDDIFGDHLEGWIHDPGGNTIGGWGLNLNARDMARFGFLYLNDGLWDGRQIVPQNWVADSIAMNDNEYGYLWWLKDENGVFSYSALGSGGNAICCVPQSDLVVAITSKIIRKTSDRRQLLEEGILPAIELFSPTLPSAKGAHRS